MVLTSGLCCITCPDNIRPDKQFTILPHRLIILTKAHRAAVSVKAKGSIVACMSTASEVFLIFTTQLYSCLCNHNAIVFISWQDSDFIHAAYPLLSSK